MNRRGVAWLSFVLLALWLGATSSPASAQWTQVGEIPATDIFSVWTHGDTIAAGSGDSVFVSTDGGATWITSAKVAPGVTMVQAVRVHDGRIYAGTYGQGVFVSNNLGATWQSFNEGLVGGFADSQLFIMDLLLDGDNLYAATAGSGPWRRNLSTAGSWSHFGNVIELDQAGNMESIAASPTRLLACGGFNGDVFYRDPGQPDWTESLLFNDRLAAGLAPLSAVWTGSSWLVGTNIGVYRSASGPPPWTYFDFGLHPTLFASFALYGGTVLTHFANGSGTGIEQSHDDGVTWQVFEAQPGIFTYNIATAGNTLYAARVDGLWRRPLDTVSVPVTTLPTSLHFAVAGTNPIHDEARFRFELPQAGHVRLDLFDVTGRREPGGIDDELSAGAHEVRWEARSLPAGIYLARLSAAGRSEVVRLARVR